MSRHVNRQLFTDLKLAIFDLATVAARAEKLIGHVRRTAKLPLQAGRAEDAGSVSHVSDLELHGAAIVAPEIVTAGEIRAAIAELDAAKQAVDVVYQRCLDAVRHLVDSHCPRSDV